MKSLILTLCFAVATTLAQGALALTCNELLIQPSETASEAGPSKQVIAKGIQAFLFVRNAMALTSGNNKSQRNFLRFDVLNDEFAFSDQKVTESYIMTLTEVLDYESSNEEFIARFSEELSLVAYDKGDTWEVALVGIQTNSSICNFISTMRHNPAVFTFRHPQREKPPYTLTYQMGSSSGVKLIAEEAVSVSPTNGRSTQCQITVKQNG